MTREPFPVHPRYDNGSQGPAFIGDEVSPGTDPFRPLGTVVAIYLDGMVELSTGDQVPAADLVLLRRAQ